MQNQDNKILSNEESRHINLVEKNWYVFVQKKCGLTLLHGLQLGLQLAPVCKPSRSLCRNRNTRPVVLNLFDLVAYPRPIKKRTGALCMGSQNNMLN